MLTAIEQGFHEPAYVLAGNPTEALGAGLVDFQEVPQVDITPIFLRNSGANEAGQPGSDAQSGAVVGATIAITLHKNQGALLAAMFADIESDTELTKFKTAYQVLSPVSLVVIPISRKGKGINDRYNWVVPAFMPDSTSAFSRVLNSGSGANQNQSPYTITGRALLALKDQADQPLIDGCQMLFQGSADAALGGTPTTSWSFPADYMP